MEKEYLEKLKKKVQKALMRAVWDKDSPHVRADDALKLWTLYATIAGAIEQGFRCCSTEDTPHPGEED